MKKIYLLAVFFLLLFSFNKATAQTNVSKVLTADSLASGNYKDILSSFYQLAVSNLTGPNKELNFNSNPFAIMLRNNPNLAVDTSYVKYRFLRRLNFGFSVKADTSYRFAGFSTNIKYALVNKRDETVSRAFLRMGIASDSEYTKLNQGLRKYADTTFVGPANFQKKLKFSANMDTLFNDTTKTFNKLDTAFQGVVKKIVKQLNLYRIEKLLEANPKTIIRKEEMLIFDSVKASFQNKPLWTIGISDTSYADGKLFKSAQITTQFLKGILHPGNAANLELDIKASVNYIDDTMRTGKNLGRQMFSFEPGINLVLKDKQNQQSYLEFKLSGSYNNTWRGLYANEAQISNTLNATLRIRIFGEVWLPLLLKYDTRNHNLFGFLNVTTNFTGLAKLLNPKQNS